jgi:hypothetical protein
VTKKAVLLSELTDDMIRAATVAFAKHPDGPGDRWQTPEECADEIVTYIRWLLQEQPNFTSSAEGRRWGVRGYSDSKWRFRVDEDREGRQWFAFVVQANAIIREKAVREGVEAQCRKIAADLQAAGFPVVMET